MRKILLLMGFGITIFNCFGQVAVELEGMNTIVELIENSFVVVHNEVPDSNIVLLPSYGKITKKRPHHYVWILGGKDTKVATLTTIDRTTGDTLCQSTFRVLKPICTPFLGQKYSSMQIEAPIFKAQGGVSLLVTGMEIDAQATMASYDIIRIPKNMIAEFCHNKGARFQKKSYELIKKAVPGDVYLFKKFSSKAGVHIDTQTLEFSIK